MSLVDKDRLQKAMETAGVKPAALASRIDRDKDYIRDYLIGRKRSLKADDAQKIADALGVPLSSLTANSDGNARLPGIEVVGTVAAGRYRDISLPSQDEDRPRIALARDTRFPTARQYALKVEGDSMNELFPDGCYVICVNLVDSGLELKNGMPVHVERSVLGGQLIETTLKEIHKLERGKIWLYPRSTNPSHEPIFLDGGDTDEISVKGVVIGQYMPVHFGF